MFSVPPVWCESESSDEERVSFLLPPKIHTEPQRYQYIVLEENILNNNQYCADIIIIIVKSRKRLKSDQ